MALSSFASSLINKSQRGLLRIHLPRNTYQIISIRNICMLEITKNLTLFSHPKKTKPKLVSQFELKIDQETKPLVVMLSWLMANKKHIAKYADFYVKRGFDVVNISLNPWQMLWPTKGSHLVARDILNFLHSNPSYGPLLIHGFSVGGYLWAETLIQVAAEQSKHQHIIDKICGQIWDSFADVSEIPVGVPTAVFPKNKVLQKILSKYVIYHLKTFDKVATRYYVGASQMFHGNIVKAPALFFISKADPIGTERTNLKVRENWDNMGIKTYWKIWDDTPHVKHFIYHPDEYMDSISKFIENIGILKEKQQLNRQASLKTHDKL